MIPTLDCFVDIDTLWIHTSNSALVVFEYVIDPKPDTKASHYYYIVVQTYFNFVWLFKPYFHKFFIKL